MRRLTLVTSNPKKAEQFERWLGIPLEHVAIDLPELQTMDMATIVTAKAEAAYAALQRPVLVEDTALGFEALSGLPGPFVRFFLKAGGPQLLCSLADLHADRRALYSVWIAYRDERGIHVTHGAVPGTIASEPAPAGSFGFGFDQCFIPDGSATPRSTLAQEAFEATSARKRAIEALRQILTERS